MGENRMNSKNLTMYLKKIIGSKLDLAESDLDEHTAFFSLGVTSLISMEILNALANYYVDLSSTLLFEYPNIETLSEKLCQLPVRAEKKEEFSQILEAISGLEKAGGGKTEVPQEAGGYYGPAEEKKESDAIAIIGVSGKFPDAANHLELYRNLLAKKDSITEIPENRWSWKALQSAQEEGATITGKWGGFLQNLDQFDAKFFKILPGEGEIMDPQQKLFLECTWEAMEDAGYGKISDMPTNNVGVYAGVTWNEYSNYANEYGYLQGAYRGPGSLYWGIPNRTSFFFNFSGPSISIDTACSSSLAAIHLACQGLRNGDCEMALAGGVNLNLHPAKYLFLSKNHFLSTDGRCRSFGEGGDGYVPGEGIGVVLLKPLAKAREDNDRIYAVIRGTAVNHGGKVTGYTVPNPMAHKDLIVKAFERANVTPEQISYIECHGTGTELGDPIEIAGLKMAFETRSQKKAFCAIGSVKSNIGHLEAAAGVAGLIKVLMSMQQREIPASLHCETENTKINFKDTPFYVVKENQAWEHSEQKSVYAGISSFGAGGSNAHCIIESFDTVGENQAREKHGQYQLLVFSGKTEHAVYRQVAQLTDFLAGKPEAAGAPLSLADVAYSLARREDFEHRIALVARNLEELHEKLKAIREKREAPSIFIGQADKKKRTLQTYKLTDPGREYNELAEIAQKWTAGEIGHLRIAGNGHALLTLPTYPFEKKRSWITGSKILYLNPFKDQPAESFHPFLARNESTMQTGRFVKNFQKNEFILEDHLVANNHVVPGVCHLEMARAAGQAYLQQQVTGIKNIWFSNKIDLEGSDSLAVCCEIEKHNDEFKFVIKENREKSPKVFSSGFLQFQELQPRENLDLDSIRKRCDAAMEISEFYEKFVRIGIVQKHSFQVCEEFHTNGNEALAKIRLPQSLESEFARFMFHPSLMDGAVQTAMIQLLCLLRQEIPIVPFSFEKALFRKQLPETVYVYSRLENLEAKNFSLTVVDEAGNILVEFVNFILKEFGIKQEQRDGMFLYFPDLKEVPLIRERLEKPSTITVLATPGSFVEAVRQQKGVTVFHVDVNDQKKIEAWLAEREKGNSGENILLYSDCGLAALDTPAATNDFLQTTLRSLFLVARSCAQKDARTKLVFCCPEEAGLANPLEAAVASFFKALARENANLHLKLVRSSREASHEEVIERILYEFQVRDAFHEVQYGNEGRRYLRIYSPIPEQSFSSGSGLKLQEKGLYLISGGLGGIGRIIAKELVEKHDARVLLLGRTRCEATELADIFGASSEGIRYFQTDIGDDRQVDALTAHINSEWRALNGLIHCAGILEDDYLLKKDWDSFVRVLAPKIFGAQNLDRATAGLDLDFFVLFSSISSIFGNLAQTDYAYANGFLDHFVAYRKNLVHARKRKGKTLAINWPYWFGGGMRLNERQLKLYASTYKIDPLETEEGLLAFSQALQCQNDQVVVLNGREKEIHRHLHFENREEYAAMAEAHNTVVADNPVDEQGRQAIKNFISHLFIKSLELEDGGLDTTENFEDLGIDSIVIIDIIQLLEKSKRFSNLPNTIFLENSSVDKVVSYFETNYPRADYSLLEV